MKVWVVQYSEWEADYRTFSGVFKTREAAEAYVKKVCGTAKPRYAAGPGEYEIFEEEVKG